MKEWFTTPLAIYKFTFPFSLQELVFRFLLPLAGFLLLLSFIALLSRRLSKKYILDEEKRMHFLKWIQRISRILIIFGVILSAVSLLNSQFFGAMGIFFRVLSTPFYSGENNHISIVTLALIIPVSLLASWAGRAVRKGLETGILKRFGLDAEQSFTIGRLFRYAVMSVVFFLGLSIIGIDLSVIGVLFGVLGIGIGFGLQSTIANFFAGISLIGMGHIKEGDCIRVNEYDGIIRQIRLMNTEITTFENESIIIPNSLLTSGSIHNYSYKDRRLVIINRVDVSYDSDLDEVIRVLHELALANPWFQQSSQILVRVKEFADSGIRMELRTWIRDVGNRGDALSWTNLEIWRRFKDANIEIPFPQRVVHLKDEKQPIE